MLGDRRGRKEHCRGKSLADSPGTAESHKGDYDLARVVEAWKRRNGIMCHRLEGFAVLQPVEAAWA